MNIANERSLHSVLVYWLHDVRRLLAEEDPNNDADEQNADGTARVYG